MRPAFACALRAGSVGLALAVPAVTFAQTGDPAADGWSAGANSMANGTYIRGGGIFSYTTYSTAFTVPSGSSLITTGQGSFGWSAGDTILGLGGVFVSAPSAPDNGWGAASAYTTSQSTGAGGSSAINGNVTSSLRMVGKFGSSPNPYSAGPPASGSWLPSTVVPGGGNGFGSDSSGHGGLGSVLLGNTAADLTGTASGALRNPSVAQVYNGAGTTAIDARVGRMVYIYGSGGIVTSWELLLNVSVLSANYGGTYADLPAIGDRGNVTVQRSTNATLFHDALVVIPAPGCGVLLALGGIAAARRRR